MVEHSWQLAMLAWYVIDTEKLPLDKGKVLQYALAHDLVETYAGDTYFYDPEAEATKHQREKEAQERIAKEHPEFASLHATISAYEAREDEESKFVYALDKTIDPLNIYLEDGLLWREKGVTLEMLLEKKLAKVKCSATPQKLFDTLFERIRAQQKRLFSE